MKSLKLQIKAVAATLLLLLFCLPFIILLIKLPISLNFHFSFNEFYQALSNAMEQSIISVIITLLLGYMGALGLVSITKSTILRKIEMVMVLPIFLPQLFVVISVSNSMFFLFGEYKGLKSILFINTLMNIGLVSVILSHSIRHIAGGPLKLAYIEGASFLQKMQQIFILIKRDFLFFLLFLFLFLSFLLSLLSPSSLVKEEEKFIISEEDRLINSSSLNNAERGIPA